jgi:hypothetical protein
MAAEEVTEKVGEGAKKHTSGAERGQPFNE